MPTLFDLTYVALFAGVAPLLDHFVFWPPQRRAFRTDPARARRRFYVQGVTWLWAVVAAGAGLWVYYGRPWEALGFAVPEGWRLWASAGLVLLLVAYLGLGIASLVRDPRAKEGVRRQMFGETENVLPHTRSELYWFAAVSLTAGFCEEFLFRGYLVWALAPWLGWWGAAALSVAIFGLGHIYQGWNGVLRTGITGTLFTLVVALTGSLWPAIVLHVLLDLMQGIIAWLALREDGPS